MEDKDVAAKPGKSIWKKSNFKKESSEKCKKNLRFNLHIDVHSNDGSDTSTSKKDGNPSNGEPSPKKRKKELDMPNIPNEVERKIEMQYHSKAKESKLTTRNVKSILKSVITNKYVVDMVRAVEEGGRTDLPFEPKLTRAKTKELLQQNPDAPVPPMVGLLSPAKSSTPEMKLLIDKELSEDSSDEEYNPENEPEPSEDDEKGDVSIASDLDSLPPTPASVQAPPTPLHEASLELSQDGIFKVPQENVGQRTRSKLDLNNLPLECLEQAYVPPDITPDMYEAECDNPDWYDFLKEFTQPLTLNETLDDDPENDPEYNILEDEEKDPVDYKEEMRKDRAVKVSKKELNTLMKELFETDSLSSDEDDAKTSESIAELEASIMKETADRQKREEEEKKKKQLGFHPNQRLLLAQQLRQHVQLTTQHFVQTYKHPLYRYHANTCKTMLMTLSGLKDDNVCCQQTHNLPAALDTVAKLEQIHNDPQTGDKIRQFVAGQIKAESDLKRRKKKVVQHFPSEVMSLMMESEAFLYPFLLPPVPFLTSYQPLGPNYFTPSEDMLLAICLEQVTQLMEDNKDIYKKRCLIDICHVISDIIMPRSSPRHIAAHIRKLKGKDLMNPVKAFFENGKAPIVCHYVVPVVPENKLWQQPVKLFPQVWRNFWAVKYEKKEENLKKVEEKLSDSQEDSSTSSKIEKNPKPVPIEKNKEVLKSQRKLKVVTKDVITDNTQLLEQTKKIPGEEAKQILNHKGILKTAKKETINNENKNVNTVNQVSLNICEKPKTTKKDICNMMEKANSIQKAVRFNGQFYLNEDQPKKTVNKSVNLMTKTKAGTKIISNHKSISKFDSKGNQKSSNESSRQSTNPKLPESIDSRQGRVKHRKSVKSKKKVLGKKQGKTKGRKRSNSNPDMTLVPKMKFKVVSKINTYYVKVENKEDENNEMEREHTVQSHNENNQQEYLCGLQPLPNNIGRSQENSLPQTFSPNTSSANTQSIPCSYVGPQIQGESDSHQSNSIESERTPLCVNIVKACVNTDSHSPRPLSTVKLKDRLNFDSTFRLNSGKTSVPVMPVYSKLNGTS